MSEARPESQRLDPATGTLLALALCHEAQGKLKSLGAGGGAPKVGTSVGAGGGSQPATGGKAASAGGSGGTLSGAGGGAQPGGTGGLVGKGGTGTGQGGGSSPTGGASQGGVAGAECTIVNGTCYFSTSLAEAADPACDAAVCMENGDGTAVRTASVDGREYVMEGPAQDYPPTCTRNGMPLPWPQAAGGQGGGSSADETKACPHIQSHWRGCCGW